MRKVSFFLCILLLVGMCTGMVTAYAEYAPPFEVLPEAVYLVNTDTDVVIYQKNAQKKMYPASTTKIMTAIVALEQVPDLDAAEATYTASMQNILYEIGKGNISTGGLVVGETMSIRKLLYAMMLQSANECAMMVADYIGEGSQEAFAELMNKKAKEIGANNTHFANPHGLHDENNYSTAYDMYLIAKYASQMPQFMELVTTLGYQAGPTNKHETLNWNSINYMMLQSSKYYYAPIKGIKTGTLPEAGRCFVSSASSNSFNYMMVVLGAPMEDSEGQAYSDNMAFVATKQLYQWAFDTFRVKSLVENGKNITEIPVRLGEKKDAVTVMTQGKFTALIPDDYDASSVQLIPVLDEYVTAPVEKGQELGYVKVILAGEELGRVPLVAIENIERSGWLYFWSQVQAFFSSFWFKFFFIFVVLCIVTYVFIMISRNRRKRRYRGVNRKKRI